MEIVKTALRSLLGNRTRSILTMLGIIIGVGAVIAMVAIGNGAAEQVDGFVAGFGANLILIFPQAASTTGARSGAGTGAKLTLDDCYALVSDSFNIERVAPEVSTKAQVIFGNTNWNTSVTGSTPDFLPVRNWEIASGACFSESDVRSASKVCVIGQTVAKELFGFADPIDSTIRIKNIPFRIVGVLAAKGANSWGQDQDDTVIVPVTTAQKRLVKFGTKIGVVRNASVQAKSRDVLTAATEETRAILRQRHKLGENAEDDFRIRDLTQALENAEASSKVMSMLLAAVAAISLLVGGIGIMNIMLVSVSERTREIGIRMAVGARPSNVRVQFLTEAVILSLLGGFVGIVGGVGVSKAVTKFMEWPTSVSPESIIIAAAFSACVGVFFGFWPAWKASNLDPIDALRTE